MAEPTDIIDTDPFDPALVEAYEQNVKKQEEEAPVDATAQIERRRKAYVAVFDTGKATKHDLEVVLTDLMWFCKVRIPTYDIRDGIHAEELSKRKEGRREVFQRIQDFSRLGSDALLLMYTDATTK